MKRVSFRRIGIIVAVFAVIGAVEVYYVYIRNREPEPPKAAPPPPPGPTPREILQAAEELELYSIEPCARIKPGDKTIRGRLVLGKTIIRDLSLRKKIVASIGAPDIVGTMGTANSWCFDPRHVVRATAGNATIDFVICFECGIMAVSGEGKNVQERFGRFDIGGEGKNLLNKILSEAGIPFPETFDCG